MANTIKLKRSGSAGDSPTSGELQHGELGLNYADGKLFFKNSSNAIQELLTSPGTSNGQILFTNTSSNFEGDNSLFWDNTNNRLGIGTNSPGYDLTIDKTGSDVITSYVGNAIRLKKSAVDFLSYDGAYLDISSISAIDLNINGSQKLRVDSTKTTFGGYAVFGSGTAIVGNNSIIERMAEYQGRQGTNSKIEMHSTGDVSIRTNTKDDAFYISDNGSITQLGKLTVNKSYPDIMTKSSDEGRIGFMDAGGAIQSGMKNNAGDLLLIADGNTERARVNSTGLRIAGTHGLYFNDASYITQPTADYLKLRIANGDYFVIHGGASDTE